MPPFCNGSCVYISVGVQAVKLGMLRNSIIFNPYCHTGDHRRGNVPFYIFTFIILSILMYLILSAVVIMENKNVLALLFDLEKRRKTPNMQPFQERAGLYVSTIK